MSDCYILRIRKKLYAKAMLHSSTYQSAKLHHVVQRKRIDLINNYHKKNNTFTLHKRSVIMYTFSGE